MAEVTAYHVDRSAQLAPGQIIGFQALPPMPSGGPDLSLDWPDGMTAHGIAYAAAQGFGDSVTPEWMFELLRRVEFGPDRISRFEAVFALPTLTAARSFRHTIVGNVAVPIVRVRGDEAHRANMALIRCTIPAATTLARAREYWRGEVVIARPPVWELLLRPPVVVLDRVDEDVPSEEQAAE